MIIKDYPDYDITSEGIITRLTDCNRCKKGHVIKYDTNKGYYRVNLSNENGKKHYFIHRLIALHFIPNPNNYPFIDHINGITTDNRIENLRWVTPSQNNMNCKGRGYTTRPNGKFVAYIRVNNKSINLGTFTTELEATQIYQEACLFYKGDFARNII